MGSLVYNGETGKSHTDWRRKTRIVDSPLVNAIDVATGAGSPGPALSLQAAPGDAQVVLTWSGDNADSYNVKRSLTQGGPYTTVASGVTAQTYTDTGLTNNTPYYYVVSGVNSLGEGSNSNEASAIPSADISGSSALKINCGGGEIDPFAADQGFTGGDAFSNPMWIDLSGVTAPAPTGVYLSAREGTFNYSVTGLTPASAYTLRLHFAEIGSDVYAPGQRIFDVTANGSTVLSAFDITAAAGTTGRAIVEQENVTADSTGTLVIGTSPVLGDPPILNGLEVISGSSAPSAPYDLIASSGNGQVALAWGSVTDAASYNVKRSATSGGPYTTIGTAASAAYTDSTVTNGQTYYYVVSAVNGAGESANSNEAEGDPEADNGAVIKIDSGGGQVGAFAYDQDFSGGGQDYLASSIDTAGVANAAPMAVYQSRRFVFGTASYTIPNLTPSGQYTVRLHFADFPTDRQQQRLTSITINGDSAYPNYDIAQSAGDRLKAVVEQWNATADATGKITVQLTQSGGDPGQINGLEILSGYSVPSAPRNLVALPDDNVVRLSWNAKNGVSGFTVKRGTASGGPYTTLASGLTSTTYTDSTAVDGTTYYYVVTATNDEGESLPSNEAAAEPLAAGAVEYKVNAGGPAVPPFAFDQYNNGGGEVSTPSAIDLSGAANPAPMAVYQTCRAAAFGFTYTFPRLVPGETYTVRLHFAEIGSDVTGPGQRYLGVTINGATVLNAFDIFQAAGVGNKAVVEQFTTTADASGQIAVAFLAQVNAPLVNGLEIDTGASYPPSPPQDLRAAAGAALVGLAWTASLGATSYDVKRGTAHDGPYTTLATGVTGTSYTDPTSPSSGPYFYVVTAVNASGESDPSNEASPTPPFTLSANPGAVTVVQGGTAVTTITASSAVDFTAPISVSASTPPTDMDVWSYPGEIDLFEQSPYPDSTMAANTKLHLFAAADTPVGTYPLTVTGTAGDYTATTTVTVTVVAP